MMQIGVRVIVRYSPSRSPKHTRGAASELVPGATENLPRSVKKRLGLVTAVASNIRFLEEDT
jgi:hypothetical protein